MTDHTHVLLVSTYELGHQPFGLAESAAMLRQAGVEVKTLDAAIEPLEQKVFQDWDLVAFYIPMHTATRLAAQLIQNVRSVNSSTHIVACGLYAPMNENYLRSLGVQTILGGEFETSLTNLVKRLEVGVEALPGDQLEPRVWVGRQDFVIPDRTGLPSLDQYAYLQLPNGEKRTAGYVEATRGCKHLCRHCPVVPVYQGHFRAIPREIVLADIRQQVIAGAQHITFGDPDFFNGPKHGLRIVEAMHQEFPELSYDVTIKIEHLLAHEDLLPTLKRTGCLFVISAVEAVDNQILKILDKGHTREDFFEAVQLLDKVGLSLSPTFVTFTPWTTLEGYLDLLNVIAKLGLVQSVQPVHLAIRLLIPPGSLLLELQEVRAIVGQLNEAELSYPWLNSDPRVDDLYERISILVQSSETKSNGEIFSEIWELTHKLAGRSITPVPAGITRLIPARLSEAWYCCAEPTEKQCSRLTTSDVAILI
jgi:radical SAM superfamily enzyme YgiQ (UPF0313 family)